MKTLLSKKVFACIAITTGIVITTNAQVASPLKRIFHRQLNEQLTPAASSGQNNFKGAYTNNAPSVQWQKCIGGKRDEYAQSIIRLADGNYLSCGTTNSHNGDFKAFHGNYDAFLMKTDCKGNILWKKTYGGSKDDVLYNATEMSNGDILAIGTTSSNDQQVSGNHGKPGTNDVWLVKTNSNGKFIKQQCYGGSGDEATALSVIVGTKGDILFTAETNSTDGEVVNNHGDYDGWVVKLKPSFAIAWAITIGDTAYDDMYNVHEVNGNFLVTGTKATVSSNFPGRLADYYKAHAALLNQSGSIIWYRIYSGNHSEDCNASVLSGDGNAVLTGHTCSTDGDVIGNNGLFNAWIWKIDVAHGGDIIWQNFFGGGVTDTTAGFNLTKTRDGGFVMIGGIGPSVEDISTWDDYAAKVNANGKAVWSKRFGGSNFDVILGVAEENDGSILMAGATASNDGDMSGNHGGPEDVWLANLGRCDVNKDAVTNNAVFRKSLLADTLDRIKLSNYPNPFSNLTTISLQLSQTQKAMPPGRQVSLQIFDKNGQLVKVLADENMEAGTHQLTWNAKDEKGNAVSAGIYFLRVEAGTYVETKKISVVKW